MTWSTAPWNNAGYPGQAPGDVVLLDDSAYTLTLDVTPANPVTLQVTGSTQSSTRQTSA